MFVVQVMINDKEERFCLIVRNRLELFGINNKLIEMYFVRMGPASIAENSSGSGSPTSRDSRV